jgi:hypothetical protein
VVRGAIAYFFLAVGSHTLHCGIVDNLYLAYIRDQRLFRTYYKLVCLVTISPVWEYALLSLLLPIEILAYMFACLPLRFL